MERKDHSIPQTVEIAKSKQRRTYLEVLIVPKLGTTLFSVRALGEKAVRIDKKRRSPPVLRRGKSEYLVSCHICRMYTLKITLVEDEREYWTTA